MWNKFVAWLKNPHGVWLIVAGIGELLFIAAAILLLVFMPKQNIWMYLSYAVDAIAAVGAIFFIYVAIKAIHGGVHRLSDKHENFNRFMKDYEYRTIVAGVCSFVISLAYAAFEATLAGITVSVWYTTLAVYYAMLAFMRGGVLLTRRRAKKRGFTEEQVFRSDVRSYAISGGVLIIMTSALMGIISLVVAHGTQFEYAGVMIFVAALYAFYKIISSIVNLVRAKKHGAIRVQTIRNINIADALVSILALQTAMLQTFSDAGTELDSTVFNAVTGLVVVLLIVGLGLTMIIRGVKLYRRAKTENLREEE